MSKIAEDIAGLVGETPLVRLKKVGVGRILKKGN